MHYQRMLRTGSYDLLSVEEKFWARVDKTGPIPAARPELGACWLWTGSLSGEYGQYRNRQIPCGGLAHRAAWLFVHGSLTPGLHIDHLCGTKVCVRTSLEPGVPSHLEETTRRTNILRGTGFSGLNAQKTHCPQNHEYTEENTLLENGWRRCRTCRREKDRARRRSK